MSGRKVFYLFVDTLPGLDARRHLRELLADYLYTWAGLSLDEFEVGDMTLAYSYVDAGRDDEINDSVDRRLFKFIQPADFVIYLSERGEAQPYVLRVVVKNKEKLKHAERGVALFLDLLGVKTEKEYEKALKDGETVLFIREIDMMFDELMREPGGDG